MEIGENIRKLAEKYKNSIIDDYKYLHRHPELSFQEFNTSEFIRNRLKELDIKILDYSLKTGVIGYLEGSSEGPCIALRADIDALPIREIADCDYRSVTEGRMHACGHDIHTGSLLGAARILSESREYLHGSVKFIFQHAEERNLGAKEMVSAGVLHNPDADAIIGLHNSPAIPIGTVAVKKGALMAAVNRFDIRIKGKGGHGGIPDCAKDPVVCAASFIQTVQTIVSRNADPIHALVISVCNVTAGEMGVNNVIPDEVTMCGTVRAFDMKDIDLAENRMRGILENLAAAYDCSGELVFTRELPVTQNGDMYEFLKSGIEKIGLEPVDPKPSTGGEDFSIYQQQGIPSFFYWLGVRNEENGCIHSWHSPRFKADPICVEYGAEVYAITAFAGIDYVNSRSLT